MASSIPPPFPGYMDVNGDPLEGGYIYIGVDTLEPITNPLTVYWDPEMTVPANQPIRTIGGYPSHAGSPGAIFTNVAYSITIKKSDGTLVFSNLSNQPDAAAAISVLTDLANSTDAAKGDALYAVKQPFAGASARTGHQKNQDILTSSDFPDLATAVSGIGATKALLIVNSPVTVSADLTIPANISLRVEGSGLITVSTGKRLFINGPFSASHLQQCFSAPLLSTVVTASVSGNQFIVTAVSSAVLAPGHVITGGGIELGAAIGFDGPENGGVGTWALNGPYGVIASTTFTATGPSVIFGTGTVETVYPAWFGAVADGSTTATDNASALAHAVYCTPWGGHVHIPAGNYKSAGGNIVVHATQSITGAGACDNQTGSPPNSQTIRQTYIWNSADNTSIFVFNGLASHARVEGIVFGSAKSTAAADNASGENGIGRKGIIYNGHYGQFVFDSPVRNCFFYHLNMGILINDSWAANGTTKLVGGDGVAPDGYFWSGLNISATDIQPFALLGSAYEIRTVGTTPWATLCGSTGGSASFSDNIMTITVAPDKTGGVTGLYIGQKVTAAGVDAGTVILSLASGTLGEVGSTYVLSSTPGTIGAEAFTTSSIISGTVGTVGCRFTANGVVPTGSGTVNTMPAYYDWGLNPGGVSHCQFVYNTYGIYINSANTDAWEIDNCVFLFAPTGGEGIHLKRSGFLNVRNCFAVGTGVAGQVFMKILAMGSGALETVNLDHCQTEFCSSAIDLDSASNSETSVAITTRDCIWQLGSDIHLGRPCEYNSYSCEVQANIYLDHADARVNSYTDKFVFKNFTSDPTWGFSIASGGSVQTMIPGLNPCTAFPNPIIKGRNLYGTSGTAAANTINPTHIGAEYLKTDTGVWYKAKGLTSGDWVALN